MATLVKRQIARGWPLPCKGIAWSRGSSVGRAYSNLAVRQTLRRQSTWNIPDVRTLATTLSGETRSIKRRWQNRQSTETAKPDLNSHNPRRDVQVRWAVVAIQHVGLPCRK
jgi:hypothetical protein